MSRLKTIEISSLNIVTQPHSPDRYIDLLKSAHENGLVGKVRGDQKAMIGTLREVDDIPGVRSLAGYLFLYTDIDFQGDWLNTLKNDAADEDDLADLNIPEHLKPGLRRVRFLFVSKGHKLYFVTKDENGVRVGPSTVGRAIRAILNHDLLSDEYGDVEVTVTPTREAVEKVLSIPSISKIYISVRRPNPDDDGDMEARFLARMEDENVGREDIVLTRQKGTSGIQPSERTRAIAEIAAENGYVKAYGYDLSGKRVEEATVDHPFRLPLLFSEMTASPISTIIDYVKGAIKK
ncbi:DUF4747 family protein [Azospirillum sp. Vi22]|uniref:DUF4747 family protein n=1 Tax=Azospirillum baldaniorum TaxID=1064539 RepID=UPI00157A27F0|nr:DUF4747 family protein [Azospirillum baldaniorum]NUB05641.1 DUF4747 family protein [Azospirillum baldaniorum]